MKAKVRITYSVELIIDAETKDQILDYISTVTPSEAISDCEKQGHYSFYEDYSDQVVYVYEYPDKAEADLKLT